MKIADLLQTLKLQGYFLGKYAADSVSGFRPSAFCGGLLAEMDIILLYFLM